MSMLIFARKRQYDTTDEEKRQDRNLASLYAGVPAALFSFTAKAAGASGTSKYLESKEGEVWFDVISPLNSKALRITPPFSRRMPG